MKICSLILYVQNLAIGAMFFYISPLNAQSSLVGTLPMQFNPAFAGAVGSPRIGTSAYLVSTNFEGFGSRVYKYRRKNLSLSFDKFVPKIGSGIGIQGSYTNSFRNDSDLPTTDNTDNINLGLSFAPKFSFKGKYTLSPAVEINGNIKNTNYQHLSHKSEPVNTSFSPGARLGLSFNASKFYIGASYHFDGNFRNYRGIGWFGERRGYTATSGPHGYLQLGYNFQKREDSKFGFSPQLVLGRSKEHFKSSNQEYSAISNYMLINLNFRYKQFVWGTSWAGYYGVQLMAGWQKKNFRIAYLHAGQFNLTSFVGEVSFRYIFNKKESFKVNKNIDY
ncbi:MAG TPA: hypothetical protein VF691_14000 [Cytophagaceae bacterium]|jgi:hypothetical protein